MKKLTHYLPLILFALIASTFPAKADVLLTSEPGTERNTRPASGREVTPERIQQLERRLEEIKAMDHKNLSRAERRELRREVKEIKKEMAISGGVYISVGALLLIILLLILLV